VTYEIVDCTAAGRMMWTDKQHRGTIYVDRRIEPPGTIECRPNWCVQPDVVASFTRLPFADSTFHLALYDPPHIVRTTPSKSFLRVKYGTLGSDWKQVLRAGFDEAMRVVKPGGLVIVKWSGTKPSAAEVLTLFLPHKPLWRCKQSTSLWHFLKAEGMTTS
jgi:hypothetical protein